MIQLRNVNRIYRQAPTACHALRAINLQIAAGDFLSVMGPPGAGKSTLLRILGLKDVEWTGEYRLGEAAVQKLPPRGRAALRRRHPGVMCLGEALLEHLTVEENVRRAVSRQIQPEAERIAAARNALDYFELWASKDLLPHQLSEGQQQLARLARAAAARPAVLLADQPTDRLPAQQRRAAMELFNKLNGRDGTTIVQATHSSEDAAWGNRILRLAHGVVVP